MNRVLSPSQLTPVPGFVVKCQLKYNGGKVMVNICSHQAVVPPNDQRGQDATQYKAGISPRGLQIPLVVGRVRPCAVAGKASNTLAEGKAVDVLVHPWVMDQINGEGPRGGPWRAEIAALAVSWVAKETKLPLDSGWKHINSKYKGGLGKKSDEPVPFDIEEAQQQAKPPEDRKKKEKKVVEKPEGVAASPAQLLKRARDLASKEEKENVSLKLPTQKRSSKKPLVQEVDKDGAVVECTDEGFDISDDIDKSERKKKPAVKKGFLRTAKARKAALYPSGSEQGETQKEGTYSRFMSKCKVVDTTTMSKEEVDAATRQYAGTGNVSMPPKAPPLKPTPPAPPSKAFDGAKKGFLNNNAKLYDENEAKKRTTEYEPEFDAAMAELDPEFSNATKNEDVGNDEDDTIAQLRDFAAKVDWASSDFSKPLHPARDHTKHDHSQRPKPAVETEVKKSARQSKAGARRIAARLHGARF